MEQRQPRAPLTPYPPQGIKGHKGDTQTHADTHADTRGQTDTREQADTQPRILVPATQGRHTKKKESATADSFGI